MTGLSGLHKQEYRLIHLPRRHQSCLPLAFTHASVDQNRLVHQVVGHYSLSVNNFLYGFTEVFRKCLLWPTGALLDPSYTLLRASARMNGGDTGLIRPTAVAKSSHVPFS